MPPSEPFCARLGRPLEGASVNRDEAEFRPVAESPFEIVEQAPVGVAEDLDAIRHAAFDPL